MQQQSCNHISAGKPSGLNPRIPANGEYGSANATTATSKVTNIIVKQG